MIPPLDEACDKCNKLDKTLSTWINCVHGKLTFRLFLAHVFVIYDIIVPAYHRRPSCCHVPS